MRKEKVLYNLLAKTTVLPISLDSSNGTSIYGPIGINDNAHTGRLYYNFQGFGDTSTAAGFGFTPTLYGSFNGYDWYTHTALSTYSTASSGLLELTTLPKYFRLGWQLNYTSSLDNARFILEADAEY